MTFRILALGDWHEICWYRLADEAATTYMSVLGHYGIRYASKVFVLLNTGSVRTYAVDLLVASTVTAVQYINFHCNILLQLSIDIKHIQIPGAHINSQLHRPSS